MLAHFIATVLSAAVALGVALQIAAVAHTGARLARVRLARWRAPRTSGRSGAHRRPVGTAAPNLPRHPRRCRDYRLALRTPRA